jgi:transposase
MWTSKNRGRYDRSRLRYPSNLTDEEWAFVEPVIPPAKRGGNRVGAALQVDGCCVHLAAFRRQAFENQGRDQAHVWERASRW